MSAVEKYVPSAKRAKRLQDFRNDVKTACVRHGFVLKGEVTIEGFSKSQLDLMDGITTGSSLDKESGWDS